MMTKRELFTERLETTGDFWRVCQDLVNGGWSLGDFEDAGYSEMTECFDNTLDENITYLKTLLLAPRHRNIGSFFEWLRDALEDPSVLDSEAVRREWVKDLENALATTGGNDYEIPARLTKSGNPELYNIRKEWFATTDGGEDYKIVHYR